MAFDLHQYIEDFNTSCGGGEAALVNRYFTDDLLLEGPDRTMQGRQHWLSLLMFSHEGVSERLKVVHMVRDGQRLMAEIDGHFVFSKDRPDFPLGPAKAGQQIKTRFSASYEFRGEQISRLLLAWWPAQAQNIDVA